MYGENIYDYIALEAVRVFCTIMFIPLIVLVIISLFIIFYKRQVFLSERERIINDVEESLFDNYQKIVEKLLKKMEGKVNSEIFERWIEEIDEIEIGDFESIFKLVSAIKYHDSVNTQEPLKKALDFLLIYLEHIIDRKNESKFSNYYDLCSYQRSMCQKVLAGNEIACEIEKMEI